jgi:glycosyltransferase involved in cell wall biosynthesis
VRALLEAGASPAVVAPCRPGDVAASYVRDGVPITHLGFEDRLSLLTSLAPWRRAARDTIRDLDPEVVHGQGLLIGGLPACDVAGMPRVVTAHGNSREDTVASYSGLGRLARTRLRDRLVRQVLTRADAVIGVHPDWRVNLPHQPQRFAHIPNIVDDAFYAVAAAPESGRVLYCGGARRIKGWDLLQAAWPGIRAAVPDATLVAAGFPEQDETDGALDGVSIRGLLSPAAIAAEMGRASLVVMPSRYEVAPITLTEAWAAGVPIVVADVGGVSALADGAATLIPAEAPDRLTTGVVGILNGDPAAAAYVAEGRERALGYRADAVARAHLDLYERLVADRTTS